MRTVKGIVLKSCGGDGFRLTKGQTAELPEEVALDLQKAGYFQPHAEDNRNKKAEGRETATAKNQR